MAQPPYGDQPPTDPSRRPAGRPSLGDIRPIAWPDDGPPVKPLPSGRLGMTGFVIVVVAAVIGIVVAAFGAGTINDLAQLYGAKLDKMENAPQDSPVFRRFAGLFVGYLGSCILGIVGWIICIVAAAKHSARRVAIAGILVGIAAVPLAFVTMSLLVRGGAG